MCCIEFKITVDLGVLQINHTIRTEAPVKGGFAADASQGQAQRVSAWIREVSCGAVQLPIDLRAIEINLAVRLEPVTQKDISVDGQPLAVEGFLLASQPDEIFSDPATNKLKIGDFSRSNLDAVWDTAFRQNDGEIDVEIGKIDHSVDPGTDDIDAMLIDQAAGPFVSAEPLDQFGTNATAHPPIVFRRVARIIRLLFVRGLHGSVRRALRQVYLFVSPCDVAAGCRPDHPQFYWIQIRLGK